MKSVVPHEVARTRQKTVNQVSRKSCKIDVSYLSLWYPSNVTSGASGMAQNVAKKFNILLSGQKMNLIEQVKYLGKLINNTFTGDSYLKLTS